MTTCLSKFKRPIQVRSPVWDLLFGKLAVWTQGMHAFERTADTFFL